MEYGLIAEKLGHSFSALIHSYIGDYDYRLCELPKDALAGFMTGKDFKGINVTIPYKEAVIPFLDGVDPAAAKIGAVNTVVNNNGKLIGYNTDFGGMLSLFERLNANVKNQKALILGTGGTSKTAAAVLEYLGAKEIVFVRRDNQNGALTYAQAYKMHSDASVLVNTTPCGMFPRAGEMPVDEMGNEFDISSFPSLETVVDAVFNPLNTMLVLKSRERGIAAAGGLYMLVKQAILAAQHFFSKEIDDGRTDEIYRRIKNQKTNIVLVGMPGSGKTTVGKLIAAKTGRRFIDLDEEITASAGKPIPAIFKEDGEEAFRNIETRAVKQISALTSCVISTGGGCVLRPENVCFLKMNGRTVFLDRSLDLLCPTDDRPLADTREKMRSLYQTRLPFYKSAADMTAENNGTAELCADKVLKGFFDLDEVTNG